MKLSCPACGAVASLDVLLGHEGARDAVMVALRLPAPLGKQLIQYLGLFRPASRQLSMDRLASLLGELLPMVDAARIERSGRLWPAPIENWRIALEEILAKRDKLSLPLKSHGYLLEILVGIANKAEARVEEKTEETRAYGHDQDRMPGMQQIGDKIGRKRGIPESVQEDLRKFNPKERGR